MALYEHRRSLHVHADPGFGLTACGIWATDKRYWALLTSFGSLRDVTCPNCIRVLKAAGDIQ